MYCYFRDQMQNAGVMGMQQSQFNPAMNTQGQTAPMMNVQGQAIPMMNGGQVSPVMNMTQPQLESLYPNTYNIIQPEVEGMCNKLDAVKGKMYCPNANELNSMVEEIYSKVESDVEAAVKESPNPGERQFYGGGRRILRDLIGILLVGNLIGRRRRPLYGYPGYFGFPYSGGYFY